MRNILIVLFESEKELDISRLIVNARIEDNLLKEIKHLSIHAFENDGCEHVRDKCIEERIAILRTKQNDL
jgi:hypothetical protein